MAQREGVTRRGLFCTSVTHTLPVPDAEAGSPTSSPPLLPEHATQEFVEVGGRLGARIEVPGLIVIQDLRDRFATGFVRPALSVTSTSRRLDETRGHPTDAFTR
jgi:hypothetical protein